MPSMERSGEYLRQAYKFAAENSTDKSTQTAAIIVDELGNTVAWGTNGFPKGVAETPERLQRPAKYLYVLHAERSAIYHAARYGIKTEGSTMYGTWAPCNTCAQSIIDSGIAKFVTHQKTMDATPERWMEPILVALQMLKEAGVIYESWEGDIGGIKILFNEKPFQP